MTAPARPELTELDLTVLRMVAAGLHHDEIAERLSYSPTGIASIVSRMLPKLGARNAPHAVLLACHAGYIDGRRQSHGDHNGYEAHIRRGDRGDEICDACRAGEKAYRAALKAQKAPESLRDAPRSPSPTPVR